MTLKKTMYPAQINSKETVIMGVLSSSDVSITVLDGGVLPEAPNLLVIGVGSTAETVLMTTKEGNILTVQRGIQGLAKSWTAGTVIARNFTAYDHDAMLENITDVEGRLVTTDAKVVDNTSAIGKIANGTVPSGDTVKFKGRTIDSFLSTNGTALSSTDFNTLYMNNEIFQVVAGTNTNNNGVIYGQLIIMRSNGYITQKLYDMITRKWYFRENDNNNWSPWKEVATTESARPTLLNGWKGEVVASRSGDIVTIDLYIENGIAADGTTILNLSEKFRPITPRYSNISGAGVGNYIIKTHASGDMTINNTATTWTNYTKLGNISFSIM